MVGPEVVSTVMARAGEHFEMPDGSTVLIMRATDETGGELVEMEFTLAPGAAGPPPHRHPEQVEEWEVLDGTLSARVDGSPRTLRALEKASIHPGSVHTLSNRSDAPVRVRDLHRPALGFEDYIATLGLLVETDKLTGSATSGR